MFRWGPESIPWACNVQREGFFEFYSMFGKSADKTVKFVFPALDPEDSDKQVLL